MNDKLRLWYVKPAEKWVEALPLGNGRIGAMVFGGVYKERIQLNEDTLWSGIPLKKEENEDFIKDLEEARNLIFKGDYTKGEKIVNNKLLGPWNESYMPLGNLYLDFNNEGDYTDYERELNIENALSLVKYSMNNVKYKRITFISKVDDAIVMKFESSKKGKISFKASFDSLLMYKVVTENKNSISLIGKAPVHVLPSYENGEKPVIYDDEKGMKFKAVLKIESINGNVTSENGILNVECADEVLLKIVIHTSFNGYKKEAGTEGRDINYLCENTIKKIENKTYEELYELHKLEYKSLFNRLQFELDSNILYDHISTDKRIEKFKENKEDLGLISLYFQYGRYLLISSSRKGTQPANLQGIWNEDLRPAWSSNYTTNINLEMNYWPAEVSNLSECHEPLFDFIKDISEMGKETAKTRYNCRGWTANHNIDLWRQTLPAGGSSEWAYWPMAGAWLCSHIWEHYEFTNDVNFLNEMYPIMKGAAEFLIDWLIEDKNGYLVTCPSISPENNFITEEGEKCCISIASTMDMAIIKNLFINCIKAANILGRDEKFKIILKNSYDKLYPYKVGKFGQLQEWFKDFNEFEKGHRHLSHLFGLYPGNEINEDNNKEIFEACRKSLERRLSYGGGHTGWSCSWVVCLFARLKDSESAYKYLKMLLKDLTFSNLLNVCPPFQIDGNFGGVAAISEMLIQSNKGYIEILPSIPKDWRKGSIKGIKARGGFELDFEWNYGYIKEICVKTHLDYGICKIKLNKKIIKLYSKLNCEMYSQKDICMKPAEDKILFSNNTIVAKIERGYILKLSFA